MRKDHDHDHVMKIIRTPVMCGTLLTWTISTLGRHCIVFWSTHKKTSCVCLVTKPPTEPRKLQRHTHQKKTRKPQPKNHEHQRPNHHDRNTKNKRPNHEHHDQLQKSITHHTQSRRKHAYCASGFGNEMQGRPVSDQKKNDVAETRHVSGVRPKKNGCHVLLRSVRRLWQLARVWRCTVVRRR